VFAPTLTILVDPVFQADVFVFQVSVQPAHVGQGGHELSQASLQGHVHVRLVSYLPYDGLAGKHLEVIGRVNRKPSAISTESTEMAELLRLWSSKVSK